MEGSDTVGVCVGVDGGGGGGWRGVGSRTLKKSKQPLSFTQLCALFHMMRPFTNKDDSTVGQEFPERGEH